MAACHVPPITACPNTPVGDTRCGPARPALVTSHFCAERGNVQHMESQPLKGRVIAIPETREVEIFAAMLERRGATVVRCPMVAIRDAPDPAPVLEWASRQFRRRAPATASSCSRARDCGAVLSCIERNEPPLRRCFCAGTRACSRKSTHGRKPARALLRARITSRTLRQRCQLDRGRDQRAFVFTT